MTAATNPKVLVIYPHLPHYRFGVFSALADTSDIDYVFGGADVERTGTIETISFDRLPATIRLRNRYFGKVLWQSGLLRALSAHRPDAAIFLGDVTYLSTWAAALLLRIRRVPVAFWTIGWHRPETGIKRLLRLTFYRLADRLFIYGDVAVAIGAQHGFPQRRMIRVGNSRTSSLADISTSPERLAELDLQLSGLAEHVAVAVVRLNHSKRLDVLVEAAALLNERGLPVTLLLAGEGPARDELARLAAARGVDARFLGAVYGEDALAKIYGKADVTVMPSAGGLSVIQSLEHGVPVITHDNPFAQMPEAEAVLPGVTGGHYREGDVDDLAREMQWWLGPHVRRDRVAADCRTEVVERWSAESQSDIINTHVREMMSWRSATRRARGQATWQ